MNKYFPLLCTVLFTAAVLLSGCVDSAEKPGDRAVVTVKSEPLYSENTDKKTKTVVNLKDLNDTFVSITKKIIPAVVSISTERKVKVSARHNPFRFFMEPFEKKDKEFEHNMPGLGSGMIINSSGYIVTNRHVIDKSSKRKVQLSDNRTFDAEIIGSDSDTDIALLKIEADNLPYVIFGNSDDVEVGQIVLAIGSPLSRSLSSTVTSGIVSGIKRHIDINRTNRYAVENFIQTDAAINPGNSGGPLVNIDGEVIGINTVIMTESGYSQGYAFAIPANIVKNVVSDFRKYGRIRRGYIGVAINEIRNSDDMEAFNLERAEGVVVSGFTPGGAAEDAGLEIGDVIIEVDGKKVVKTIELQSIVTGKDPGDVVNLTIMREGEKKFIDVTLKERNEEDKESAGKEDDDNLETALPDIGIGVAEIPEETYDPGEEKPEGVMITEIKYNGAAMRKGLLKGDIIWKIGSVDIASVTDYEYAVKKYKGRAVRFFIRDYNNTGDTHVLSMRIPK